MFRHAITRWATLGAAFLLGSSREPTCAQAPPQPAVAQSAPTYLPPGDPTTIGQFSDPARQSNPFPGPATAYTPPLPQPQPVVMPLWSMAPQVMPQRIAQDIGPSPIGRQSQFPYPSLPIQRPQNSIQAGVGTALQTSYQSPEGGLPQSRVVSSQEPEPLPSEQRPISSRRSAVMSALAPVITANRDEDSGGLFKWPEGMRGDPIEVPQSTAQPNAVPFQLQRSKALFRQPMFFGAQVGSSQPQPPKGSGQTQQANPRQVVASRQSPTGTAPAVIPPQPTPPTFVQPTDSAPPAPAQLQSEPPALSASGASQPSRALLTGRAVDLTTVPAVVDRLIGPESPKALFYQGPGAAAQRATPTPGSAVESVPTNTSQAANTGMPTGQRPQSRALFSKSTWGGTSGRDGSSAASGSIDWRKFMPKDYPTANSAAPADTPTPAAQAPPRSRALFSRSLFTWLKDKDLDGPSQAPAAPPATTPMVQPSQAVEMPKAPEPLSVAGKTDAPPSAASGATSDAPATKEIAKANAAGSDPKQNPAPSDSPGAKSATASAVRSETAGWRPSKRLGRATDAAQAGHVEEPKVTVKSVDKPAKAAVAPPAKEPVVAESAPAAEPSTVAIEKPRKPVPAVIVALAEKDPAAVAPEPQAKSARKPKPARSQRPTQSANSDAVDSQSPVGHEPAEQQPSLVSDTPVKRRPTIIRAEPVNRDQDDEQPERPSPAPQSRRHRTVTDAILHRAASNNRRETEDNDTSADRAGNDDHRALDESNDDSAALRQKLGNPLRAGATRGELSVSAADRKHTYR